MTIPLEKEKTPTTNSRRPTLIQHWKELEKMVQPCASIKKKKKSPILWKTQVLVQRK